MNELLLIVSIAGSRVALPAADVESVVDKSVCLGADRRRLFPGSLCHLLPVSLQASV